MKIIRSKLIIIAVLLYNCHTDIKPEQSLQSSVDSHDEIYPTFQYGEAEN